MYKLIRPLLFLIDPEKIHHLVFSLLRMKGRVPGFIALLRALFSIKHPKLERTILGLKFSNPVGLAAGFDKDARLVDELAAMGFGFIEIGTVTPRPQPGNDKPRLFRLPKDEALINRMGFNNGGAIHAAERLKRRHSRVIIGGNIGKNKLTPNDEALDDYAQCFQQLYPYVDYFVINVSSPNTPGLRELQEKEPLRRLLQHIKSLSDATPQRRPVLLKIAPDLELQQLDDIIEILLNTGIDGVVATNTTISREGLVTSQAELDTIGAGGLSGRPLTKRSTDMIRYLRKRLGDNFPIIGVGGIMTPEDAIEKMRAGADLVQIYTGFVYEGPGFIKRINKKIIEEMA